ncbi:hypothetical protein [Paludibaculum fermentans]|uniref:hypothetical protein n=1 Tax=Paludibaculum fermentans TaxID=1473598 RepID=UPI003EBC8B6D
MGQNRWLRNIFAVGLWAGTLANGATLYQYEGFAYQPGSSIFLQNGGTGWSGAWGTPGGLDATIAAASLTSGGLAVSGGSLSTAGAQPPNQGSSVATWVRYLGTSQGADNTTVYFSFLLRPDAGFGYYGGLNLGSVFAGLSGNQSVYGLEGPVNDLSLSSTPVVAGQSVLFVLRADFHAGNDTLSLFLNPTPGLPEPAVADATKTNVDVGAIDFLTINNYGGFTMDELRIGSTFDSVTPTAVPEPGYAAGIALASFLLAWSHRKRRLGTPLAQR